MRILGYVVVLLAACCVLAPAWAQKPSVYPSKGQSSAQQSKDDGQCQAWAKQDSGVDPVAVANAPPPPSGPQGERLRGAARGAIVADVVGGDAGKGAAVGTLAGGRRARLNQAAKNEQASAAQSQQLNSYYRAYGACMQGRGYSVR